MKRNPKVRVGHIKSQKYDAELSIIYDLLKRMGRVDDGTDQYKGTVCIGRETWWFKIYAVDELAVITKAMTKALERYRIENKMNRYDCKK